MELIDDYGLPVAMLDTAEALDGVWESLAGRADVARVDKPANQDWPALRARGFFPKPQQVTWQADVGASEEEFMQRLTSAERQKVRGAWASLASEGLRVETHDLGPELFDEFLALYVQNIQQMRHGANLLAPEKVAILAEKDSYIAVCARDGDDLVGGCLARREPERKTVRIRFSAVDLPHRESSLSRVLYLQVGRVAREIRYESLSLGKDPNLYGHVVKPGLLRFKRQLGFIPCPSHLIDPSVGWDQADAVLGFTALGDPAMLLAYADDVANQNLRLQVFATNRELDLRPFSAKFCGGPAINPVPSVHHLLSEGMPR